MSRPLAVLAVTALALVAGCTTVPPEQRAASCAQTDWYRFGVNDGALGVPASDRADTFRDCQELGRPVDIAAYQRGRAEGLAQYCTVQTGYEAGRQGRAYENVCPPELEPDFLHGMAEGRKERSAMAVYPRIGIGIGSGGVRTGVGVGIGLGGYWHDDCYWRDPFPCSWRRRGFWGYPYW